MNVLKLPIKTVWKFIKVINNSYEMSLKVYFNFQCRLESWVLYRLLYILDALPILFCWRQARPNLYKGHIFVNRCIASVIGKNYCIALFYTLPSQSYHFTNLNEIEYESHLTAWSQHYETILMITCRIIKKPLNARIVLTLMLCAIRNWWAKKMRKRLQFDQKVI